MIDLAAGQAFTIDDQLISEFPWYDLGLIKQFTIDCEIDRLPTVKMRIRFESQPRLVAFLNLNHVSVCQLPELGIRSLQFSQMMIQNVRDRQLENIQFEIFDESFHEPLFLFNSGEVLVQTIVASSSET